jgi:RHS repeat-associated protein
MPDGKAMSLSSRQGVRVDYDYIWLDDLPVAQITETYLTEGSHGSTNVTYLHPDHLGTPRLGTNSQGLIVWKMQSDGFGVPTITNPYLDNGVTINVRLRLPGQIAYGGFNGVSYNYYRDYDPNVGRYLESDPIGLRGGRNTYVYVGANPIMSIDSFGLDTLAIINGPIGPTLSPPSLGNPFGHSAVAATGSGLYSPGNNAYAENLNYEGSSVTDYLRKQQEKRDSIAYVLPTGTDQERSIIDYIKALTTKPDRYPDNCAGRVEGALRAGGIELTDPSPWESPADPFPASLKRALDRLVEQGKALPIFIPQGGPLPVGLEQFNPSP